MARERRRFVADPFLEVAVAADDERAVVAELWAEAGAEPALGDAHADGVGEALAQRAGGDVDARGVVDLGVAGRAALPLTERLQVVDRQPVAGEEEHGVLEDAGMAGGQHEAIPVRPVGIGGVVAHDARPQDMGQRRQGHGRARVTGVRLLRGVHRQPPNDVDAQLFELGVHSRPSRSGVIGGFAGI